MSDEEGRSRNLSQRMMVLIIEIIRAFDLLAWIDHVKSTTDSLGKADQESTRRLGVPALLQAPKGKVTVAPAPVTTKAKLRRHNSVASIFGGESSGSVLGGLSGLAGLTLLVLLTSNYGLLRKSHAIFFDDLLLNNYTSYESMKPIVQERPLNNSHFYELPQIGVGLSHDLRKPPYAFNDSWFRVVWQGV